MRHGTVIARKPKARSFTVLVVLVVILLYSYYNYRSQYAEVSILDFQDRNRNWIHQSWMDYPQPISFTSGPSLLSEANPKPLHVLFVNYHRGVENDINGILQAIVAPLNQTVRFTTTRGV